MKKKSRSGRQKNVVAFKPLSKKTFSDEIIDQILSMIITGELKAGDKLPAERQLSESFGVSRNSLREALKTLESLGIVRRSPRGTTVCAPEETRYPSFSLAAASSTPEQVAEVIRILSVASVALAAERATKAEIKRMETALQEPRDGREAVAHHYTFHRTLATWSGNPLLMEVFSLVAGLAAQDPRAIHAIQQWDEERLTTIFRKVSDGHSSILRAVEANDVPAAKKCMGDNLDYIESVVAEVIESK